MTALAGPAARRPGLPRRGFTIVELLVVAGLIAVLAALITPAVIRARSAARNAAIKAEIDMLHMAIMTYRNEFGSFPPCSSPITSGSAMARHLQRVFPRCDVATHLTSVTASAVSPQNAFFWWLSGYTLDPTSPLLPTSSLKVLFDFDRARLQPVDPNIPPSRSNPAAYAPAGRSSSPYLYFDAPRYGTSLVLTSGSYAPVVRTGTEFFNPDSFQILCAGQDGIWGNEDDLSNFWRGTRAQHAASSQ